MTDQKLDLLFTDIYKKIAIDQVGVVGPHGDILPIHAIRSLCRIGGEVNYVNAITRVEHSISTIKEQLSIQS